MIDPDKIAKIYVSPRARARETLSLLALPESIPVEVTESLVEFNYGDYEGMKTSEIKAITGNDKWETWVDPAPNAETPAQIQKRIDTFLKDIRTLHHLPAFEQTKKDLQDVKADILLVAHGHILRGLGARWINADVTTARALQLDAGGVGVLGYEHHAIEEPAINRWNIIQ